MKVDFNSTRVITLLYYAAKSIGLAPFMMRKKKLYPATLLGKAYAIVVAVMLTVWVFHLIYKRFSFAEMTMLHQIILISWGLAVTMTIISTVFMFALKSEKIVNLMDQMNAIDGKLRDLLVIENWCHEETGNDWITKIIKSNSVVLLLLILRGITFACEYKLSAILLLSTWSMLFTVYLHNIILIFVQILLCVKQHFEYLNKNLQDILNGSNFVAPLSERDLPNRQIFVVDRRLGNSNRRMQDEVNEPRNIQSYIERIKKIEILHNELTDLVESTTQFFTMPIISIIYQYFFRLILLLYNSWAQIVLPLDGYKNLAVSLPLGFRLICQLIITIYDMVLVSHACASTCKAGNTTRSVLVTIWNKFQPAELKNEFVMFSFQMVHKPLAVIIFGFFDLGYPCLFQIFSGVISYALVVMQLEPSLQN